MPAIPTLPLSECDLQNLRESGLEDKTIQDNRLHTESDPKKIAQLLRRKYFWSPAPIIPYFDLHGNQSEFVRVRPHRPRPDGGKYESPVGGGCRAYFPKASIAGILDGKSPVFITEGEKKALAISQLGFVAIGIGGVDCGMKNGELIPDLAQIHWHGRDVYLVFDYDPKPETRRRVKAAAMRLTNALIVAGAK